MDGTDVVFQKFLDLVQGLGIGGGPVFAVLWWLERKDRKTLQSERDALLTRVLDTLGVGNAALATVANAFPELRNSLANLTKTVELLIQRRRGV